MSLIIATGSNQGNCEENLQNAQAVLETHFKLIKSSRVYSSKAVDYCDQPFFLNQVHEFEIPKKAPAEIMTLLLSIERSLGRERKLEKGPRIIDLDILFFGNLISDTEHLNLPHPRLFERSFVLRPLSELPYYKVLEQQFKFNFNFEIDASPI
ncbi:MAG: 2-amino-4-hydroxy-6-hydroxymethyldihydropteridine diphosphokinase [Bacteriovoracaceae bacterium]|jgi:2-amino-4-hydroxy-6-hydroxymethyldihydropteridine diphosphokinase|nr:2-amino-4-hydroxy-6-hydroxymethyldihydropteridine diphosphokinase [Bacteriovoracaceae bacterium]